MAGASAEAKQLAIREARRRLQDRVRSDWRFELDDWRAAEADTAASHSYHVDGAQTTQEAARQAPRVQLPVFSEWRERTYASSDPSSDENDEDGELSPRKRDSLLRRKRDILFGSPSGTDSSSHETSGASAAEVELQRREQRKRRRRQRLEAEMTWNQGLRFWQARRDAWSCAEKPAAENGTTADDADEQHDSGHGSSIEAASGDDDEAQPASFDIKRSSSTATLVPVAPALILQGDPTHIAITPALYPSIYSKVVLQSLTPSVPINLRHLIAALVEGWRRDGDWPPKGTNTSVPVLGTSRAALSLASAQHSSTTSRLNGLANLGSVRKGMARMKRSLRLSLSGGSGTGSVANELT